MKFVIKCRNCKKEHEIKRDKEAPIKAVGMGCNWCPDCQDSAREYYREWYTYGKKLVPKTEYAIEQMNKANERNIDLSLKLDF